MKRTILYLFALFLVMPLAAASEAILGIDGEESTSVGIYIKDLRTDSVLLDFNSQLALTPASVMKCVTSASVLSLQGGERRFSTRVSLRGAAGSRGVWSGDLVVHAVADPTLESENFRSRRGFCDSIVAGLRRRGISRIDGSLAVEHSLRQQGPVMQWECEDIAWPYGAGLYGFNWRDNCVTVYPNTGRISPAAPGLEMKTERSTAGNDFVRGVGSDLLMVYSRNTRRDWAVKTTVPDPTAVFEAELREKLQDAGISLGTQRRSDAEASETDIYTHTSPTYAEILKSLMVRSDNLFAEGMLRSLAPAGLRKDAISREKELWATRGVNPRYTIINDGSGLTRANRLSARFIAGVLEWMASSLSARTYCGFFPRAGREGTMRGFLSKSPLKGRVALKTGSVSSVQAYAGYCIDDDGMPTHVVVVLVNGFFCPRSQVRKGTEQLLEQLFL